MIKKAILSSGTPILMQKMNSFYSFMLGVWIKYGSRHEPLEKNGLAHFIEHLLFQGTSKRDAKSISLRIDSLGGDINAFTSREFTSLYIKVLDKYIPEAIELIGDIFSNPSFPENEIEKERFIIIDEIRTIEDTPDELIHDLFMSNIFSDSLGQPVFGRKETVMNVSRDDIINCFKKYYSSKNCIISCAGNFNENKLIEEIEKNFIFRNTESVPRFKKSTFNPSIRTHEKDLNEVHICLGMEGIPFNSPHRYTLSLLNLITGGCVSSKLFQEIREKKGYAYNIYSFLSCYSDTGIFGVYTACEKSRVYNVVELIISTIKNLQETLTEDELQRAKKQAISQLLFSSESTNYVMQNLAYQELYLDRIYSVKEQIRKIESIKISDLKNMAEFLKNKKIALTVLGSIDSKNLSGINI